MNSLPIVYFDSRGSLNRDSLTRVVMALLLIFCVVGAVWTVYWSVWFGLAPRPLLSAWQTILRFVVVMLAVALCLRRRNLMEKSALVCAAIAAGSSGLYGLGVNSITLQVVRLLFHFLAYSLGAVVIIRWFHLKGRVKRNSLEVVTS